MNALFRMVLLAAFICGWDPITARAQTTTVIDTEFQQKAADIIGLYLKPPVNAGVFCVDEKSAIQALDRLDPVLPLSPGRAERHGFEYGFEYFRHGTLSLYAALNTRTGDVMGKTTARRTSAEFGSTWALQLGLVTEWKQESGS